MDLYAELDKLTAPLPKASNVRTLSREEIAELQASGSITPPEEIPYRHFMGRISLPEPRNFTTYDRRIANRHRFL